MLPKSEYKKLSRDQKLALKRKLGMLPGTTKRRYKRNYADNTIPKLARQVGRYLGALSPVAPAIASDVGAYVGEKLGRGIKSVFGHGDYVLPNFNVQSNTLINPGDTPPQFGTSTNDRITRVRHREYIADVFSSTGFSINGYYINPGLGSTFPWLSSVAGNYECYRIMGMLFEFKSMSSDALNSTNTALGSVIMATQYNAADASFVSKQQMENYEFAQSCKPSQCMLHYIECNKTMNPLSELYVRTGTVPSGQTQQVYDLGEFFVATTGMQAANVNLGELWVTYDIELFKPKLIQGQYGNEINYFHGYLNQPTTSDYFNGISKSPNSNLALITGPTTITFPSAIVTGSYQVTYSVHGTGGSTTFPALTATTNCTGLSIFDGGSYEQAAGATSHMFGSAFFKVTGPGAQITFSGAVFPTGINSADIFVTQVNGLAD